nr:hypothetical protein HmN_000946700 [Hymenolepis microstoma]
MNRRVDDVDYDITRDDGYVVLRGCFCAGGDVVHDGCADAAVDEGGAHPFFVGIVVHLVSVDDLDPLCGPGAIANDVTGVCGVDPPTLETGSSRVNVAGAPREWKTPGLKWASRDADARIVTSARVHGGGETVSQHSGGALSQRGVVGSDEQMVKTKLRSDDWATGCRRNDDEHETSSKARDNYRSCNFR